MSPWQTTTLPPTGRLRFSPTGPFGRRMAYLARSIAQGVARPYYSLYPGSVPGVNGSQPVPRDRSRPGNAAVTVRPQDDGMTRRDEPAALLVVRVWIQDDPATGFRARLLQVADLHDAHPVTSVAGSTDEVLAMVSEWLTDFVDFSAEPDRREG